MADLIISGTTSGPCACCGSAPCHCALLLPLDGSVYEDYATAAAALAAGAACLAYFPAGGTNTASDATPDTLVVVGDAPAAAMACWASINLKSGSTLSVDWSALSVTGGTGNYTFTFRCFSCNGGTMLDEYIVSAASPPSPHTLAISTEDEFLVYADVSRSGATQIGATVTFSSDDILTVNPVLAAWDDSGSTRILEACPQFFIPPSFDAPAFANATVAQDFLDGDLVSACIGAILLGATAAPPVTNYLATDGGTSFTQYLESTALTQFVAGPVCCLNLLGGSTLAAVFSSTRTDTSVPFTLNGSPGFLLFGIYDRDWQELASDIITPWSSSGTLHLTVPYTGKFYLVTAVNFGASLFTYTTTMTAVISCDDVFSANLLTALYVNGANCPSLLPCEP